MTRLLGTKGNRQLVSSMTVRQLLAELELRGIDASDCVEREDLLTALCGPPPAVEPGSGLGACACDSTDASTIVDKMV